MTPRGPEGAEVAALKDQMLRYAADAENTRRRAEREINDARAYAIQKFARDLLGVADNLARAMSTRPRTPPIPLVKNLAVGLEMTQKELLAAFERNGLKPIAPDRGAKFDPHQHQAVMEQTPRTCPPAACAGSPAGYELFGRVVRPAMVIVDIGARIGAADPGPRPARVPRARRPFRQPLGASRLIEASSALLRRSSFPLVSQVP
jgi:molecular chaperone GrpE